jgi:hypothetical protein
MREWLLPSLEVGITLFVENHFVENHKDVDYFIKNTYGIWAFFRN